MEHRVFLRVDLIRWVFGTIEKVRNGADWTKAWTAKYSEIGGYSSESGRKVCPMATTRTLYEFGRIRGGEVPFRDCDVAELWGRSRNGAYGMLAIRLLSADPTLNMTELWLRIQSAVRRETGEEPAASNQGGATVVFKLWHLGLIVGSGR